MSLMYDLSNFQVQTDYRTYSWSGEKSKWQLQFFLTINISSLPKADFTPKLLGKD